MLGGTKKSNINHAFPYPPHPSFSYTPLPQANPIKRIRLDPAVRVDLGMGLGDELQR